MQMLDNALERILEVRHSWPHIKTGKCIQFLIYFHLGPFLDHLFKVQRFLKQKEATERPLEGASLFEAKGLKHQNIVLN